jgi:hypothetical protein
MNDATVVTDQPIEQPQEQDLRATLQSALTEAKTRDTEQIETQAEKNDRLRDEQGRFSKVDKPELKPDTKPDAKIDKPLDLGAGTVEMPKTWNQASKGYWDKLSGHWVKLPPEVQQLIDSREQEVHKGFTRQDDERAFGREMHKAVQPYLQLIQSEGGTPARAVSNLLQTAALLRTGTPEQKTQAIMNVVRAFNVQIPGSDGKPVESNAEIAALREQVSRMENYIQQRHWNEQQQTQASIESEIETFASDPKNAHFETVKADMAALLKEGRAKDLQDAYDKAMWAHPDLRGQLLAEREREAEQKKQEEIRAKAQAAKRKAISIVGAPGNTQSAAKSSDRSLRDEIRASVAEASGRV